MLDQSSKSRRTALDPLADMLRGLRLDGVEYERMQMAEPWALVFPAQRHARLHLVFRRGCLLRGEDGAWTPLGPGDAVLLPHGTGHVLASGPDVEPRAVSTCSRSAVCEDVFCLEGGQGAPGGGVCRLFSASLHFNIDPDHPLMRLLPDMILARDLATHDTAIPHVVEALLRETELDRVGAAGILARLADVLAASLIRSWVEQDGSDAAGWLAAVREPDIGRVLAAIHLDPARDWSVPVLAGIMGASRSSFAQRFTEAVGESPARYVARVRMQQARSWLSRDRMRVAEAAARLGYESEASFSRAFRRIVGVPPSSLRSRSP
jgi:AraC-like DNA-binding protein